MKKEIKFNNNDDLPWMISNESAIPLYIYNKTNKKSHFHEYLYKPQVVLRQQKKYFEISEGKS